MVNKIIITVCCAVLALSILFGVTNSKVQAETLGGYEQQKLTSYLLANLFLEKIEQDGLVVFGNVLNRTDLQSHHVSYEHNFEEDTFHISLCFKLNKQVLVPSQSLYYVDMIVVDMDKNGNILEIQTHIASLDEGLYEE